jgi:hypothetical protein
MHLRSMEVGYFRHRDYKAITVPRQNSLGKPVHTIIEMPRKAVKLGSEAKTRWLTKNIRDPGPFNLPVPEVEEWRV